LAGSCVREPEKDGTGCDTEKSAFDDFGVFCSQNSSSYDIDESVDVDEEGTSTSSNCSHDGGTDKENFDIFVGLNGSVSIEFPEHSSSPVGIKAYVSNPTFVEEGLQESSNASAHEDFPS